MGTGNEARDVRLAQLAGRQHGVVSHRQLRELGFSAKAIKYRVRMGRLHPLYRGVYAVGHPAITQQGRYMAAVLACGPEAVLSHTSAAVLWEFLRPWEKGIHMSMPRHRSGQDDICVHWVQTLRPEDCTRRHGVPVTSVPRTLLDVAAIAPAGHLARAVNEADRRGWLNRRAIEQVCARNRGRKGVRTLREIVSATHAATRRTRSDGEVDFLQFCRKRRLPLPEVNAKVEGYEVDFYWPRHRLIVELDSYEYHRTRAAFERDRRRDAHLKSLGYDVIRITYYWLEDQPQEVAALLRARLG